MVLTQQLPDVQVILVDDVMTSGGHFKASVWLVEDQRRKVEQALCCGRSLESQLDDPFTLAPEAIDLARSPFG
jgi:adenine/guanine phosphoribosyltransferase-like PRPP-binding protein